MSIEWMQNGDFFYCQIGFRELERAFDPVLESQNFPSLQGFLQTYACKLTSFFLLFSLPLSTGGLHPFPHPYLSMLVWGWEWVMEKSNVEQRAMGRLSLTVQHLEFYLAVAGHWIQWHWSKQALSVLVHGGKWVHKSLCQPWGTAFVTKRKTKIAQPYSSDLF